MGLQKFGKYSDLAVLLLRVVFGSMFLFYGAPKFFGGPEKWAGLGQAMGNFNIHFFPVFWGFMAACAEFCGGICLILGLFFRPFCCLLTVVMVVAARMHLAKGDGLAGAGHAIEAGAVFLSLFIVGPGRYSLEAYLDRSSQ